MSSGGLAWARASALASGAGVNRRGCTVASRRRGWEVGGHWPAPFGGALSCVRRWCQSTWLHRGVPLTGLGGRWARASPVDRALLCSRIDLHLHLRQVQMSSGGLACARASARASGASVDRPGCTVASRRRGWEVGAHVPARLAGRCCVAGLMDRPAGWHGHAHLYLRRALVSIDLATPWCPVDGGGRSVRTCQPG